MDNSETKNFEQLASEQTERGFILEYWTFLKQNKKWWLLPIVIVLLLVGVLVLMSGSALAPFIYTLF